MQLLSQQLPSGGYGYPFPSITINPMTFFEVTGYLGSVPEDPLNRYLFDMKVLEKDDHNIRRCYIMDIDFLIFVKKLITVSKDLSVNITVTCPDCKKDINKTIQFNQIRFKAIDPAIMEGSFIELNGRRYETIVPTVDDFMKVFQKYLVYRKLEDLDLIKTIALIKDFEFKGNEVEDAVVGAKYEDITMLLALKDLYYDRVEPIQVECPECNKNIKNEEERRYMTVSVNNLIVDFFREIVRYNPIDATKIQFKQVRKIG